MSLPVRPFDRCNVFRQAQSAVRAHDGCGYVLWARIATGKTLDGACNFIDFTTMPPGTTVGEHTHSALEEEYYLILKGRGRMTCNGEEFDVGPGDLIRNPPGGTHALVNTGAEDLEMFVFEVAVPAEATGRMRRGSADEIQTTKSGECGHGRERSLA